MRKSKPHPTIEIKRKVVRSYREGHSAQSLAKIFGYDRITIHRWVREDAAGKLKTRKIGSGRPPKLDDRNAKRLVKMLKKPASEFGFETDLWNSSRICKICKRDLKIKVSRMAVWRILSKFDQSFKKVQKRYYEVDAKKQDEWKKKTLPAIKRTVKKYKAILYFEDESKISLTPVMGKSWGPIGEKIIHKATGNRGSVAAISAISSNGRLVFSLFGGNKRFKSQDIIDFLTKMLAHHPRRHLVVVMDQATCHKSKVTKKFIDGQKRLHVFYLPPRSPEFNPDEQVWAHLKNHSLKSHQQTNEKGLKRLTRTKLNALSRNPSKVRGVFRLCENHHLYL